jgi:hypothetical protein
MGDFQTQRRCVATDEIGWHTILCREGLFQRRLDVLSFPRLQGVTRRTLNKSRHARWRVDRALTGVCHTKAFYPRFSNT